MNLALIISSLSSGGAERALSGLANYWVSQGHHVTIITLAAPTVQPFYALDPKINIIQLDQTQTESSLLRRFSNIFKRIFCLRKVIITLNPDIITSFMDVMNMTTLIATRGLKIPVVVAERSHPAHNYLPAFYKKLRMWLYPKANRVIVQTASAATYFHGASNLEIIPNAVTVPLHLKEAATSKVQNLISVGRLCPFKGFDTLILAFAKISASYPHLTLTIYGEGEERSHLESLITSLGLRAKVLLPGVTQNIHEVLVKADLFVFPSQYEGFPNALCEAMAVGLPVIASDCSGNVDVVRDTVDGRFFPIGNVDALASLILELLEDEFQRNRLSENAKEICKRFHPDRTFKMWDAIIVHVNHQ